MPSQHVIMCYGIYSAVFVRDGAADDNIFNQ